MTTAIRPAWTGDQLEGALRRRRLAREGGAYTLLLDDAGGPGRLAGLPIAVKDVFDIAGTRTGAGSAARRDAPHAAADAAAVAALRAAGARLVGKTALHEFAFGVTGINDFEGTPRNPHDAGRIAGGSSSGSAVATAEGSCVAALGTDTGGSVRIPAALCGVVGVKPSFGLIPTAGVYPLAPSLDHVGVLARDVATAAEVLRVLAPQVDWDGPRPRTVGLDAKGLADCSIEVGRAVEGALRASGVSVREIELPDPELVFAVSTAIMFTEAAAEHAAVAKHRGAEYGTDVRERLILGAAIPASAYLRAKREAAGLRERMLGVLLSVDAIVGPTVGTTAYLIEDARDAAAAAALVRHTRLWNVTGLPAVSLPVHDGGLPIGLQVIAATDARAVGAAFALERG